MITSSIYEPQSLIMFIRPIDDFLCKEHALIVMKLGKFKECFDICVDKVQDISFSLSVARHGFKWHNKERRIYYNLFTRLMESKSYESEEKKEENKAVAIKVLTQNCQYAPYEKITKNFADEEEFSGDMNKLYRKVF